MTGGGSSIPEVQRLVATLVAAKPGGRIAEIGTAYGEGAKAIASSLAGGATFVTVEPDDERYRLACDELAGTPAEVVHGRWQDVLPERGPFDLIFLDGGTRDGPGFDLAISLLAPGGLLVKDDLTPGNAIDGDPIREALLLDPRLEATELLVTPTMAAIVAVRRA
jgi:predicted O-methyltransferase YrrM